MAQTLVFSGLIHFKCGSQYIRGFLKCSINSSTFLQTLGEWTPACATSYVMLCVPSSQGLQWWDFTPTRSLCGSLRRQAPGESLGQKGKRLRVGAESGEPWVTERARDTAGSWVQGRTPNNSAKWIKGGNRSYPGNSLTDPAAGSNKTINTNYAILLILLFPL